MIQSVEIKGLRGIREVKLTGLTPLVVLVGHRAKSVQDWLDNRPNPPATDPKEHAWSYMAGWYAEHGCESFYSNLWNDPQTVAEFEKHLTPSGTWQLAAT